MLAVVFGYIKFHDYIYGIPNAEVESPLRLLKMIMTTQKYSLNVTYQPGTSKLLTLLELSR